MMEQSLRFGIVGCGMISRWHAEAIRQIPGVTLAAVCDAQLERAESFAADYGAKAYSDMNEFLQSDLDAVSICTPSGLHARQAIAALRAGKNVLVEKPLGLSLEDLAEVRKACEESGKLLGSVFQLQFSPDVCRMKESLEKDELGKVLLCDLALDFWREPDYYKQSPWRGTRSMDGGALMNQGIHGVGLMLHLMGGVRSVTALAKTEFHDIEAEDTAAALLEFENGAMGVVHASTASYPGSPRVLRIAGTNGTAELTEDRITRWDTREGSWTQEAAGSSASDPAALSMEGHRMQVEDFVRALREGTAPAVGLEEGSQPVELILAIYRSAETGKKVVLEELRKEFRK